MSSFLTWQLVDSAFPTGTFAHSWGLEAAWQHGEIGSVDALREFVDAAAAQTAWGLVPLLNASYEQPARWPELDDLADAFLRNVVANRASRQQGRTLLTTVERVWAAPALEAVRLASSSRAMHLGPVAGMLFRSIGIPLATAQQMMLFGTVRGVLSAATRLGIVGSYEAQRLQYERSEWLEHLSSACNGLGAEDLAQVAPVADLFQATHDHLYSRLFQS